MAYDILRRKQTTTNRAITLPPKAPRTPERVLLGATAAAMLYELLSKIRRNAEAQHYKQTFGADLKTTVKMRAMPMDELTAIPYYNE